MLVPFRGIDGVRSAPFAGSKVFRQSALRRRRKGAIEAPLNQLFGLPVGQGHR
jgi:hypothetical protein